MTIQVSLVLPALGIVVIKIFAVTLSYQHSHFSAAILGNITSFFTLVFLGAAPFFYNLAVYYASLLGHMTHCSGTSLIWPGFITRTAKISHVACSLLTIIKFGLDESTRREPKGCCLFILLIITTTWLLGDDAFLQSRRVTMNAL